jgi:hypothetical protein
MMQHQVGPSYRAGFSRVASNNALAAARSLANTNGSPVGVWHRDGWLAVNFADENAALDGIYADLVCSV